MRSNLDENLGRLLNRLRWRLRFRDLRRDLRRGLSVAAAVLGAGALLYLELGWPKTSITIGIGGLTVLASLLPALCRLQGGSPSFNETLRFADSAAAANALLLTARESSDAVSDIATRLIRAQAAAALPEWRHRLRRLPLGPLPVTLLPPALVFLAAALLLAAIADAHSDLGDASLASPEAPAAGPLPASPIAALDAAIARLKADQSRSAKQKDRIRSQNDASADATSAAGAAAISAPAAAAEDLGAPAPAGVAGDPPRARGPLATMTLSPGGGAGAALGTSVPSTKAAPANAIETAPITPIPVDREGRQGANATGGGFSLLASGSFDSARAMTQPTIPRPTAPPRSASALDPARRALVSRYHTLLGAGSR